MATTIVMPQLSSTMEKGTIVQWLKQVGDEVSEGEAILEITTDKVDIEVESPAAGVLLKLLVDIEDEVPVKEPIAIIGEAGEDIGDVSEIGEAAPQQEAQEESEPVQEKPAPPKGKIFASPRARRLAKESGIDVTAVTGTGPRGRIVSQDVRKYAKEGKPPAAKAAPKFTPGQVVKLSSVQRTVAQRLTMSYRTAPHIDILMDVNCENMVALRNLLKAQSVRVSYNDILAKYLAVVLREFPMFNSVLEDDGVHLLEDVNIGIAAAIGDELIVPVVKNVDKKDVKEVASESGRIIAAARDKKLSLADVSDGTFTITNLGMFGVRSFKAIINPPQVAILAVGGIEYRAVVLPGQIAAQQMMSITLSIDHRVVNGAQGGEFLARLKELIEIASLDVLMTK